MKKIYLILTILVFILLVWLSLKFLVKGNEENKVNEGKWVKDSRGVWINYGNPSETPDYVVAQQRIIDCALNLYQNNKTKINLSSQCLGACENYAVDIVHVPRTKEDNLIENQCSDYNEGRLDKFIEIDKDGNVVRIT